jgi:hypothetical protein
MRGAPTIVNAYCTHLSPPEPAFPHTLLNRRDRSDPEMKPHLRGFQGFGFDDAEWDDVQTHT